MGDVIDLRKVSDSANGMGEQAEVIKAKIKEVEALVEKYVASGAGVWDGESAAAYRNNFNKVVETVGSLCDASIALSNNIKGAVEAMAKANDSLATPTGGGAGGAGSTTQSIN